MAFVQWFKYLVKHYRVVVFDNCGWGLNERFEMCSGYESPQAAETFLLDFMTKSLEALDLPAKFFLLGHSMGGYLSSLYASQHAHRIKALFCVSAAGMETYDPQNYHPERYPDFTEPTKMLHPKMIKAALRNEVEKLHPLSILTRVKQEVADSIIENNLRTEILAGKDEPTEE